MQRLIVCAALVFLTAPAAGRAQEPSALPVKRCIWWRFDVSGDKPAPEPRTREGEGTMALQLRDGDSSRLFSLDTTIREFPAGSVHVTVRDGNKNGPVIDEFDVQEGGGVSRSSTRPSFGLSVIEIYDLNEFFGPDCGPSRTSPGN